MHPELNSIDMICARVKRIVAMRNLAFQLTAVEEETKRQIEKVLVDDFNKYYKHSIIEEEKYNIHTSRCDFKDSQAEEQ